MARFQMHAATKPNPPEARAVEEPRNPVRQPWVRRLRCVPMLLALSLALFLELRAKPSLSDLQWMPREMVRFFDTHDFLNNAVAFGGLAATVHFAFAGWARESWSRVARRAAMVGALVVALECAQLLRPLRVCDWHDMAAGWLGIGLASVWWLRPNRGPDPKHAA